MSQSSSQRTEMPEISGLAQAWFRGYRMPVKCVPGSRTAILHSIHQVVPVTPFVSLFNEV